MDEYEGFSLTLSRSRRNFSTVGENTPILLRHLPNNSIQSNRIPSRVFMGLIVDRFTDLAFYQTSLSLIRLMANKVVHNHGAVRIVADFSLTLALHYACYCIYIVKISFPSRFAFLFYSAYVLYNHIKS